MRLNESPTFTPDFVANSDVSETYPVTVPFFVSNCSRNSSPSPKVQIQSICGAGPCPRFTSSFRSGRPKRPSTCSEGMPTFTGPTPLVPSGPVGPLASVGLCFSGAGSSHPRPSPSASNLCGSPSSPLTVKSCCERSGQLRSGGGGGMQKSGYEGSQAESASLTPSEGGGDAGESRQ